jgi:hypothetical protein
MRFVIYHVGGSNNHSNLSHKCPPKKVFSTLCNDEAIASGACIFSLRFSIAKKAQLVCIYVTRFDHLFSTDESEENQGAMEKRLD